MKNAAAAAHVRKALAAATSAQLQTLASRPTREDWRDAPAFDGPKRDLLRKALKDDGHNLTQEQGYISAQTYAGMKRLDKAPSSSQRPDDRMYTGIESVRGVKVSDIRAADIEAQAVFWVLLVYEALAPEVRDHFLSQWREAGLPLPRRVS